MSIFDRKLEHVGRISMEQLAGVLPGKPAEYGEAPEILAVDLERVAAIVRFAYKHRDEGMPMDWDFAEAVDQLRGGPPK